MYSDSKEKKLVRLSIKKLIDERKSQLVLFDTNLMKPIRKSIQNYKDFLLNKISYDEVLYFELKLSEHIKGLFQNQNDKQN